MSDERASEGSLATLPEGLATCFALLATQLTANPTARETQARRLSSWLASWIPAYLRSCFPSERARWQRADWQAFEEDVVQHTLLASLRRGVARWSRTTDDHALRWIRAVVRNFLVSHGVRWRQRRDALTLPPDAERDTVEIELVAQQSFVKSVELLRRQIPFLVRRRDLASAERLFDELVATTLAGANVLDKSSDLARQRRRRGRRLAARAWHHLGDSIARESCEELAIAAGLLGIVRIGPRAR